MLAMPATVVSQPTRHLLLLPASSTGVTSLLPLLRFTFHQHIPALWPLSDCTTALAPYDVRG
ncbi:gluconate-binding protein [Yersinia similis]|uniref:Gluconate-binding protein n=1 Tax=Yersinia similis TaxID=367190 RepID=A0ABN4CK41_9GAMM|nr:gluconate-binding protein [Yersinia similis]